MLTTHSAAASVPTAPHTVSWALPQAGPRGDGHEPILTKNRSELLLTTSQEPVSTSKRGLFLSLYLQIAVGPSVLFQGDLLFIGDIECSASSDRRQGANLEGSQRSMSLPVSYDCWI